MAKTYINTVKYMINLNFEIDGIVEKPDIIGAIFGQSEGLLGDEMDLKELQKNGKVGRIEIDLSTSMGRTKGKVDVPSSMDMAETSILAAGIESVDKVGPCEARFEIVDISDMRSSKREEIKNRAKELLQNMLQKSSPETQQLTEEIKENVRAAALILAPEIKSRIRCFALGAQYDPKTRIWNKNEFNIRNDLNAFDYLLNLEGLDLTMMCLQAALPLQFKREETYSKLDESTEAEKILEDRWREQNPQDENRVMWDLALVEAYLKPAFAQLEAATTPPENEQRKIRAYIKIDEKALADDFWKALKGKL